MGPSFTHSGSAPARPRLPRLPPRLPPPGCGRTSAGGPMFGQEMLASTATTAAGVGPGAAQTDGGGLGVSSARKPQMLATTVAPARRQLGQLLLEPGGHAGFCRPTLLTIPPASGCRRGAGLPAHGSTETDFTTTAPRAARSTMAPSSAPCPAVPDAVITGLPTPPNRRRYAGRPIPGRSSRLGRRLGPRLGRRLGRPPAAWRHLRAAASLMAWCPSRRHDSGSCPASWYSCRLRTCRGLPARSAIPPAAARPAAAVVRQGTRCWRRPGGCRRRRLGALGPRGVDHELHLAVPDQGHRVGAAAPARPGGSVCSSAARPWRPRSRRAPRGLE